METTHELGSISLREIHRMTNSEHERSPEMATSRLQQMLLDFITERADNLPECPVCGYSLKALVRPICPECGQVLTLAVGAARLHLGWLLATLAPGFFSGIAAFFLMIPIVLRVVIGDGQVSPALVALDAFGWCSGAFAIIVAMKRIRFLAQERKHQRWWALAIWLIHIAALVLFAMIGPQYL